MYAIRLKSIKGGMALMVERFSIQYTTRKTGQKTRVPRVSPSKTAGHFRGQLSASRNLRDILSSVDFPWFQRHRNTRPTVYNRVTRQMRRVRHFSRDLPRVTLARHCPFSRVVYCRMSLIVLKKVLMHVY